jgi:hypothetical protein
VLLFLIVLGMLTIGAPQPMIFLGITTYALSGPVALAWRLTFGRRHARLLVADSQSVTDAPGAAQRGSPTRSI